MKFPHTHAIALFSTLLLTNTIFPIPAPAVTFDQQEIEQSQLIAIARPFGSGQYDLLILQQIPGQRQCWSESGSNPTIIEPLLLNFDFTGICDRSTDSNGYSIRLDGQDYGLNYLLRLVKRNGELVLVGTHRTDAKQPEVVVGHTNGMTAGFMKISLAPGWRFTKRAYQGKVLSHIYLTGDSSAIRPPENQEAQVVTDSKTDSTGKIREITITAGEAQPNVTVTEPEEPAKQSDMGEKAIQRLTSVTPTTSPAVLPAPSPKISPLPPAVKPTSPPPLSSPAASPTTYRPAASSKTLPPPPSIPSATATAATSPTTLPPASSPRNSPPLPSFSQLPPLPPPSPVVNSQVVPPPTARATATGNRKTLSDVLSVSPRQSPTSNPDTANVLAENPGTASQSNYRVMVQADNRSRQEQLRSLYPDAFPTRYQGQSLWQIGVFSSRDNADSALQNLQSLGFQGNVIQR